MTRAQPIQIQRRPERGFSLVEVLVALLVLSIGLLGLAALQTVGLKFNTQSYQRTQATLLGYDIIDRIRANSIAKAAGNYDSVTASYFPPSPPDCTSITCNPAQLATYDIAQWKTAIATMLTGGQGAISTPSNVRVVTITWTEDDLTKTLVVEARL